MSGRRRESSRTKGFSTAHFLTRSDLMSFIPASPENLLGKVKSTSPRTSSDCPQFLEDLLNKITASETTKRLSNLYHLRT